MTVTIGKRRSGETGFALLMVLGFMVVSFLIITGVLYSTSNAALQTDRHQRYYATQEAATAAAERAVAGMIRDVRATGGVGLLSDYEIVPMSTENPAWWDYDFALRVTPLREDYYSELIWKYRGLSAVGDLYRVQAGARTVNLDHPIASVVEQEIQVAEIPLFALMGYSAYDLSFVSIAANNIILDGRVHSNGDIYCLPSGSLIFREHVTAAGAIRNERHPKDVTERTPGVIAFEREADAKANTMRLAPGYEDPYELLVEMANIADLFVIVSGGVVVVHDGFNELGAETWGNFITTGVTFRDGRQIRTVMATEIDMERLAAELGVLGWGPGARRLIYLDDRTQYGTEELAGFRLINGYQLPAGGLSVVTTNSLYVKGDYNTINPVPAMLAADAVTLVSSAWDDTIADAGSAVSTRINAAVITGVPVVASELGFDGGFFNSVRLLEVWTGQTMTFRGSIAAAYRSRFATEHWRGDYYKAPSVRVYSHESSYTNLTNLPKGTPMLHTLIRGEWIPRAPGVLF